MRIHPTLAAPLLALLAGCLSPKPPESAFWTIEIPEKAIARRVSIAVDERPARLTRLDVLAPFSKTQFCVLRPDGSLAFDAYNEFAAPLANTLWGPAVAVLRETGAFGTVVGPNSSAEAGRRLELVVGRVALDCRQPGKREALVDVMLNVLNGRMLESVTFGSAAVPTADENYTAAFSAAFADALREAVRQYAKEDLR